MPRRCDSAHTCWHADYALIAQRLDDRLKLIQHTPLVCICCAYASSTCAHHEQQHYGQAKNGENAAIMHMLAGVYFTLSV